MIKNKEIIVKTNTQQSKIYKNIFSKKYLPSIKLLMELNKV
jgi:hypothetical protein